MNGGNDSSCYLWHRFCKLYDSQSVEWRADLSPCQTESMGVDFFSLKQNSSFESQSHRQLMICTGHQYLTEFMARNLAIFHDRFPGFLLLCRFNFDAAVVIAHKDSISGRQANYCLQLSLFCCFCWAYIVTKPNSASDLANNWELFILEHTREIMASGKAMDIVVF